MWSAVMDQKKLIELIFYHLKRYTVMELEDVYKLLYQSVMGPAHILQNKELAYFQKRKSSWYTFWNDVRDAAKTDSR